MPSTKDWEGEGSVATEEPVSRDSVKRHRSSRTTSERKDRDRDRERDRDRDRDRDYRERDRERDVDRERAPRDKSRYRDKERDRDRERERERERERDRDRDGERDRYREDKDSSLSSSTHRRHHSTRSSKRPTDSEGLLYTSRSHSHRQRRSRGDMDKDEPGSKSAAAGSMTELVPELARGLGERVSFPYPSVNKNYSKEALYSKEDVSTPARRTDPPTPEPTDLGSSEMKRSKSTNSPGITRQKSTRQQSRQDDRPPSPPETDLSDPKKRSGTPSSQQEDDRPGSRNSYVSRAASKHESKSKLSRASSQATFVLRAAPSTRQSKMEGSEITNPSTVDSDATQVLPRRTQSTRPRVETDSSPESAVDSSPKTPLHTQNFPPPPPPVLPGGKDHYATSDVNHYATSDVHDNNHYSTSDLPTPSATPAIHPTGAVPPPPPPPPPPASIDPQDVPRVDYLMQNGGLPQPVPRQFLSVLPRQNGTRPSNPPLQGAETLFAPFFNLLNQYQTVINGSGSVAVATGHRTVARRLLDRLENVFNRDLPPHGCNCVMCERSDEVNRGLGWGEVLERVSGRVELPPWPPFDFSMLAGKAVEELADVPPRPSSPVKMDPDIAEEFREHYLRQTQRVKMAVDKWMVNCEKTPAPPPTEVDDETLSFAILTNLDTDERPYFNAFLTGSRELQPANRAPTPARKSRNDFVVKAGLSLQRLYRLPVAPRDAEAAVYLVRNPGCWHDLLVTISEITSSEWEILISGRFDGFLWSGAEDDGIPFGEGPSRLTTPASNMPSRLMSPGVRGGMSRTTTPFGGVGGPMSRNATPFGGFSRGPTPASFISGVSAASSSYPSNRASITHDEETEIACLAELEREIFNGMEALEDAFEKLHEQAMGVRDALRRRGAALSMSLQQRRGGLGMRGIDVLPLSGSSGVYDRPGWADDESVDGADSEWGADEMSELAPDDSASQISSNRMRRPKRRRERATPGVIEEEDEQ